jgi:uracil phosphoribosyltransferase
MTVEAKTRAPLTVITHPLVQHKLSLLRDQRTSTGDFRRLVNELTTLITYEATKDFPTETVRIETPLEWTEVQRISGKKVAVCPVLRAGVGMLDGFLSLVSGARVGFIGLYRDEDTLEPFEYYESMPPRLAEAHVFVVDPMLATGGSAVHALDRIKAAGGRRIALVCLVVAPQGLAAVEAHHPEVPIWTAAVDRELDEHAYIRPGLGDAGDRVFGTG